MKKKKIIILALLIPLLIIPIISLKADTGWDFDYDSGWDSDYDSDWRDRDYHRRDHDSYSNKDNSYNGSATEKTIVTTIINILVVITIITIIMEPIIKITKKPRKKELRHLQQIIPLTQAEINDIDPTINIEEIKKYAFDLYKNIQIAWMNFDYEKLREYLSDELYNNYKMQLETLKMKNGQNIMEDITYINSCVSELIKTDDLETIKIILTIAMKDYVIDNNNKVIRGDEHERITITYLITLERSIQKELKICPNCGSQIDDNASTTCPYCNSVIVKNTEKFIMTKKENIEQQR